MAAPVGGQVFSEILPYLKVIQGNEEEIETVEQVSVPKIEGMNLIEAQKTIKELGLKLKVENDSEELDKESTIITEQSPKEGITVNKGSNLYVKY